MDEVRKLLPSSSLRQEKEELSNTVLLVTAKLPLKGGMRARRQASVSKAPTFSLVPTLPYFLASPCST